MRAYWLAVAAVLLGGVGSADEDKELAALDGSWAVLSITENGSVSKPDEVKVLGAVIKSGKFTEVSRGKEVAKMSLKIDPTKTPKQFDLTYDDGPAKGKVVKGIYKFEGDKLVWCEGVVGGDRPTKFESRRGPGFTLITYQKKKDGE